MQTLTDIIIQEARNLIVREAACGPDRFHFWVYPSNDYTVSPAVDAAILTGMLQGKSASQIAAHIIATHS